MNKEMNPIRIDKDLAESIVHQLNVALNAQCFDGKLGTHDDIKLFGYQSISYERLIDMLELLDHPERTEEHQTVEVDHGTQQIVISLMDALNLSDMLNRCTNMFGWLINVDDTEAIEALCSLNESIGESLVGLGGPETYLNANAQWESWRDGCKIKEGQVNGKEGQGSSEG